MPLRPPLPLLLLAGCAPDPAQQLPPAPVLCERLEAGAVGQPTVLPSDVQVDADLTAAGEDWRDAGLWGAAACGSLFDGVVATWTAPEAGTWRVRVAPDHLEEARAAGHRMPFLVMQTDPATGDCACGVSERQAWTQDVVFEAGESFTLLVGLEHTAERSFYLEQGGGYAVPFRVQLIPQE